MAATKEDKGNPFIGIEVSKNELKAKVAELLGASLVYAAAKDIPKFAWTEAPAFWAAIVRLVEAVIAAVEIAKTNLAKAAGTGKISGALAASVAIDILDETITFTGVVGKLVEAVDGPALKLIVNIVLGDRHGVDWLAEAYEVLGLKF